MLRALVCGVRVLPFLIHKKQTRKDSQENLKGERLRAWDGIILE